MKSKLFAVVGLLCSAFGVWAQSSTFTYQGQLSSNNVAATGQFDLRFALFDAATIGNPIGAPLTNAPTGVTNGLFLVTLDFGSSVFDGSPRWLEIGVRTNGSTNVFTTLSPRQLLTATPYAVRAANYSGLIAGANITGKISDTNLSANVALLTNNVVFTRTVTASNFIGSGLGLTNLSATNLIGTLPDARLSTNVALLNLGTNAFLGSISATNFYGFGGGLINVPGRLFDFVPTGSSLTAQGNYGYLATNDTTPVTITLPPTLPVGSTVRVSGSGAAGWIVAQNAGQSILMANLVKVTGGSWRAVPSSSLQWMAAAASGDGRKLVAVVNSGLIYSSADYGLNWAIGGISTTWKAAAASGNGNYLFAAYGPSGFVYYSANGGAWTASSSSSKNWSGVASSVSGQYVVACVNGEFLYRSTGFGASSWGAVLSDAARSWTGIASSGDGVNLAACAVGANIYASTNSGANWYPRATSQQWSCIAASADGGIFVAGIGGASGGQLYVSYDSGFSWIPTGPSQIWTSVSCSGDGSRMIASYGGAGGGIYVSQDAGASWQLRGNLTSADFKGAAVSGDGTTAIAVGTATPIYVSSQTSTTVGATGQLIGARLSAVELQHIGNGVFIPVSSTGNIRAK